MADPVPRFLAAPTPPREVAVTRAKAFEAAPRFSAPRLGKAARLHGHNFVVTATIAGPIDPTTHFLVDFRHLDALLDEAVGPLDHRRLDLEYPALAGREPSTEALAAVLYAALGPRVRERLGAGLGRLRVAGSDALWAERDEGGGMELTRPDGVSAGPRPPRPGPGR